MLGSGIDERRHPLYSEGKSSYNAVFVFLHQDLFVNSRSIIVTLVAGGMLAGCGGTQPPLSMPLQGLASQQSLPDRAYKVLHEFDVSPGDGAHPSAELINVKDTLYGTTPYGGSNGSGTVFSITKSGKETVLHSFGGSNDGAAPMARLLYVSGSLYGTTSSGGENGSGTVFNITPGGAEKVLHSFGNAYSYARNGGTLPLAGLIDVNGTLYGTTYYGGAHACNTAYFCGTVFSITTSGKYKVLHDFGATNNDGENPAAALLNVNGMLYGTTYWGGKGGSGTVFGINTAGKYHVLYSFGTNPNDGLNPTAALIHRRGILYGTTSGGIRGGNVFSVATDGTEKVIYSFSGSDGSQPLGGVIDLKGVLYGTTAMGGAKNVGTVFSVTTSGQETVLYSFRAGSGENPRAGLLQVGGTLYGTTYGSINETHGNVFSLTQ
jgi:uncharacterized repeat protein (TIGR03803 family)